MAWTQVYDPMGGAVWSALVAGIPLISLFYMLAVRRAKGHYAAALAVALSFVLALFVWGMPVGTAFSALTYGAAFGLFPIIWIVVTAVWVYNMTVESGEFEYIKESLARRFAALVPVTTPSNSNPQAVCDSLNVPSKTIVTEGAFCRLLCTPYRS